MYEWLRRTPTRRRPGRPEQHDGYSAFSVSATKMVLPWNSFCQSNSTLLYCQGTQAIELRTQVLSWGFVMGTAGFGDGREESRRNSPNTDRYVSLRPHGGIALGIESVCSL